MIPGVRKEIEDYIYSEIVPRYAEFDPAHREDHAVAVIDNSMKLYREAPAELRSGIDPEVLAVAAAAHDLGRIYGKEDHHINSGKIIRADENLRRWFSPEQIEQIAEAAEDHRASAKAEPRSIYGKIVAEADRLIDQETIIRRTLLYGMSRYPDMSPSEQIARALEGADSPGSRAPLQQVRRGRLSAPVDTLERQCREAARTPCPARRPLRRRG